VGTYSQLGVRPGTLMLPYTLTVEMLMIACWQQPTLKNVDLQLKLYSQVMQQKRQLLLPRQPVIFPAIRP